MKARVRIRGVKETAAKIEALSRAGGEELVKGVRVVAEMIRTDVAATRPGAGVPKKEGTLMTSLQTGDIPKGAKVEAGGASAPYALVQHERMDFRHNLGEARYLVRGLERFESGRGPEEALQEVADAAIRAAKRG